MFKKRPVSPADCMWRRTYRGENTLWFVSELVAVYGSRCSAGCWIKYFMCVYRFLCWCRCSSQTARCCSPRPQTSPSCATSADTNIHTWSHVLWFRDNIQLSVHYCVHTTVRLEKIHSIYYSKAFFFRNLWSHLSIRSFIQSTRRLTVISSFMSGAFWCEGDWIGGELMFLSGLSAESIVEFLLKTQVLLLLLYKDTKNIFMCKVYH